MTGIRRSFSNRFCLSAILALSATLAVAEEPSQPKFFLPQNPVAAAYVLGRLSNQELIEAPRGEFVYEALLQRAGLDRKYRLEALDGLASLRHSDRLTEFIQAVTAFDKKGDDANATLQELTPLLFQFTPQELSGKRVQLDQLALKAQLAPTRRLGWAGRIAADDNADAIWRDAQANPEHFEDFLRAICLIPEASRKETFHPKITEVLKSKVEPAIMESAASALVKIPGHDLQSFNALSTAFQSGFRTATLLATLASIPTAGWPTNGLGPLAESVLDFLKGVPPDQRATPEFTAALQFENELAARVPADQGRDILKTVPTLGPMLVTLHAIYEQMRFDKELIVVETGKPVVITLQNDDAMPHNVAILAPGALQEIGQAAEKMPAQADSQGRLYVPASEKVLHATKLVAPGQGTQLAFTAPGAPDDYPFTCTFPGHWLRMSGTMRAVADPEAYLAAHPASEQPKLTEWKLSDFSLELSRPQSTGNAASGSNWFSKLACVQCHRLGSPDHSYGPDLTDVFKRYHNDHAEVLDQVLEPSKRIDDRYRNYNFDLNGGEPVQGIILKEDEQTVTIQSGPADSLVQTIKKSDILQRRAMSSSPMPSGLLNALTKTQILDLLAYLEAGGIVAAHEHKHPPDAGFK